MNSVSVSSPGKCIIFGEHAVVYGKTALAASLSDLRTNFNVQKIEGNLIVINASIIGVPRITFVISEVLKAVESTEFLHENNTIDETYVPKVHSDVISLIEQHVKSRIDFLNVGIENIEEYTPQSPQVEQFATKLVVEDSRLVSLVAILYLYLYLNRTHGTYVYYKFFNTARYPALQFSMDSSLPIGAGLGSSASFAVCLASSLLLQSGTISVVNLKMVNTWSYLAEQLMHGTPSGIDNAVGTFGGVIAFSGGKIQRQISQIPNLRILIVNTTVNRNTKAIVAQVRVNRDNAPIEMDAKLDEIQSITEKCLADFDKTNAGEMSRKELQTHLETLVDRNHILLNEIGAGHVKLDLVVSIAKKHGYHAKLTGAGGGGCAFVLLEDEDKNREEDLKRDLTNEGFKCYASGIGSAGLLLEE